MTRKSKPEPKRHICCGVLARSNKRWRNRCKHTPADREQSHEFWKTEDREARLKTRRQNAVERIERMRARATSKLEMEVIMETARFFSTYT